MVPGLPMNRCAIWLAVLALAATRAEAALVTQNLPDIAFGHAAMTLDTDTGLQWLDVDLTRGLSFNAILAGAGTVDNFGRPVSFMEMDWRHATFAEVCGLCEPRTGGITGCRPPPHGRSNYAGVALPGHHPHGRGSFREV